MLLSVPPAPRIQASDRLSMTLFLAAILHGIIILGVSFKLPDENDLPEFPTMEITLVHHESDLEPDKADFLAQANQDGGGESEKNVRPSSPVSTPTQVPEPGLDEANQQQTAPQIIQQFEQAFLTAQTAPTQIAPRQERPEVAPAPTPSAAQLISRSMEIASLSAAIEEQLRMESKHPRQKFISARTRESKYVGYMEAWRAKVERIGNLNYPEEAKRRGLAGNLILDVAINLNGTIREINLVRTSGHKALDDAAIRIVRLASPFAPLPKAIREETDILHIIRTWQFLDDYRLHSR